MSSDTEEDPEAERREALAEFINESAKHIAFAGYCRDSFSCQTPLKEHVILFPVD